MRSVIGLKNMIMFSAILLTFGSVSAQQAFGGLSEITTCTIILNQMVNTQIPANENVVIQKVIQCDGNIFNIEPNNTDCVLNDPQSFSNFNADNNIWSFDETITNGGDTSEEHCELEILVGDDFGNVVLVTQELWINLPENMPIGGTSFPVSTTSLLVAGFQANMGLLSLALVGMVAAGAAITYKLRSKKTEQ